LEKACDHKEKEKVPSEIRRADREGVARPHLSARKLRRKGAKPGRGSEDCSEPQILQKKEPSVQKGGSKGGTGGDIPVSQKVSDFFQTF